MGQLVRSTQKQLGGDSRTWQQGVGKQILFTLSVIQQGHIHP